MRALWKPLDAPATATAHAHWRLDEASGNAVDSVGIYLLTAYNSPGATGALFAEPAGSTGARTFNGTNQFFQRFVNDATLATLVAAQGSVSVVFRPDSVSSRRTLFAYEGTTASAVQSENKIISVCTNGTEVLVEWEYLNGNLVSSQTTGAGLAASGLYQLVVSWAGAITKTLNVYLFEKGVGLVHRQTFTGLTGANGGGGADMQIGRGRSDTAYYDGAIDDVALWKSALSLEDAHNLYLDTLGVDYDEEVLYDRGGEAHHLRVRVEDADGVLIDLTNVAHGQDAVISAEVSDDIDSPGATARVTVMRELDAEDNAVADSRWSFARDIEESPFNLPSGAFDPLLTINRRILVDTAVTPEGEPPNAWDWQVLFEGYIDAVDWGSDEVTVECVDQIGPLVNTYISKQPFEISSIDDTGTGNTLDITTTAAHNLSAGDTFQVYDTNNFDGSYTVRTAPTTTTLTTVESIVGSPASESSGLLFPADVTVYGSTGLGDDLEDVIQDIIDDNAPPTVGYTGGTPTLYTPSTPAFGILPYYQQRESVQAALETLSMMIGWSCRYKWDSDLRTHRLTLYAPDRTKTTPDYTFSDVEILDISQASIDGKEIRNAVEVIFSDNAADPDGAGQYPRVTVRKEDSASIADYGYRLCQIAEASTSQINTYAEAEALADAVLADLAQPKANVTLDTPLRRFVELGDLYRVPANKYVWSAAKDLAVVGYTHTFNNGQATTSLTMRGKPAVANAGWYIRFVSPGLAPNQPTTPPISPSLGPQLTALAEGVRLASDWPYGDLRGRHIDQMEVHLSETSGFLPSSSTLEEVIRSNRAELHGLDPAKTYYVRTRYRDRWGNYSIWSPQSSITPRYLPNMPAARAYRGTSDQTISTKAWTTIQYNAEDYDKRNNYSTSTYKFTAPVTGLYQVSCHASVSYGSTGESAQLRLVKGASTVIATGPDSVGESHSKVAHPTIDTAVNLTAGDAVFVQVFPSAIPTDILHGNDATLATTVFSIRLVSQD